MTNRVRSVVVGAALLVLVGLAFLVAGNPSDDQQPVATGSTTAAPTRDPDSGLPLVNLDQLPRQVSDTVTLIERGGPYPHRQDGVTFANRERILPRQASGYYREYTVDTPGSADRGARRVVTGDHDRQFFYTGDHYATFVRIRR